MTVRLFDADTDTWSLYWTSTRAKGRIEAPLVGQFRDGILLGTDGRDGQPLTTRFRWDGISETTARWQQELTDDGGATWELDWIMEFTRV